VHLISLRVKNGLASEGTSDLDGVRRGVASAPADEIVRPFMQTSMALRTYEPA